MNIPKIHPRLLEFNLVFCLNWHFVDSRLTNLEKKSGNDEYFEEFETRFEIMAQELADFSYDDAVNESIFNYFEK